MGDEKKLTVSVVYKTDHGSATQAAQSAKNLGKSVSENVGKGTKSSMDDVSKSIKSIGTLLQDPIKGAEQLTDQFAAASLSAAGLGAAIDPVTAVIGVAVIAATGLAVGIEQAAQASANFYGYSTPASAKWLDDTDELTSDFMKLGSYLEEGVLPVLNSMTNIIDDIVKGIDNLPAPVKAALGFTEGILGGTMAGEIGKFLGTFGSGTSSDASSANNKQLQTYLSYTRSEQQAQTQFLTSLSNNARNFYHTQQVAQQDFSHQMAMTDQSFQHSQSVNYQNYLHQQQLDFNNYQYQMMVDQRSFDRSQLKALSDHNREMYWENYDHQYNLQKAAEDRDAVAAVNENRQYAVQKMKDESDFAYQQEWAKQEHDWTVSDQKEAFARQQKIQQDGYAWQQDMALQELDFNKQVAQENFDYTQAKAKEQNTWSINESQVEFKQQQDLRKQQLEWTLSDERDGYTERQRLLADFNTTQLDYLNQFVNNANNIYARLAGVTPAAQASTTTTTNNFNLQGDVNSIMDRVLSALNLSFSQTGGR